MSMLLSHPVALLLVGALGLDLARHLVEGVPGLLVAGIDLESQAQVVGGLGDRTVVYQGVRDVQEEGGVAGGGLLTGRRPAMRMAPQSGRVDGRAGGCVEEESVRCGTLGVGMVSASGRGSLQLGFGGRLGGGRRWTVEEARARHWEPRVGRGRSDGEAGWRGAQACVR